LVDGIFLHFEATTTPILDTQAQIIIQQHSLHTYL